jgi:hypothetical protein
MQPMTVEQSLKILWDATESIRCDGPTRDALRQALEVLKDATNEKPKAGKDEK